MMVYFSEKKGHLIRKTKLLLSPTTLFVYSKIKPEIQTTFRNRQTRFRVARAWNT